MRITLKTQEYDATPYELTPGPEGLLFRGEKSGRDFAVPYGDIRDIQVTETLGNRLCFTMLTGGVMFEGAVSDRSEVTPFTLALKKYWSCAVSVEMRKK